MAGSEIREDDLPVIADAPNGSVWLAWLSYSDRNDEIALRRRHTYGATDDILLDVRVGPHFMGDEFHASAPVPMRAAVRDTHDSDKVDVLPART